MPPHKHNESGRHATLVAAGILLSRLMGLVRQRLFAHYLGSSPAAAAFTAAMRIPNLLQNLLGEGVLSASFIPVYAGLRAQSKEDEADEVAGAVFGLLALVTGVSVAVGLLAAPVLVELIAPGFVGSTRELTVELTRILFPATGVLVLSAWCLGVLNSHRRFFLSYAAPVVWNVCIIFALVVFRRRSADELALWAAWGVVVGGLAQFAAQVPATLKVMRRFRPSLSTASAGVRQVLKSFPPAFASRGVVQVSAYVDVAYASLISERGVAVLSYAQTIALLPVSLFGMAISAAELPAMSEEASSDALRSRLTQALDRLAFFVVPSAVAFVLLGDVIAGLLLQSGRFTAADTRLAWYVLVGASFGLLGQTRGRLYASTFFALKDTRTPLKFAVVRVVLGIGLGFVAVRLLPGWLGLPFELGTAGVTATTAATAWLECWLLKRRLAATVGAVAGTARTHRLIWLAALVAGVCALVPRVLAVWQFGAESVGEWGGQVLPPPQVPVVVMAPLCLGIFGLVYFALSASLGIAQARAVFRRISSRF